MEKTLFKGLRLFSRAFPILGCLIILAACGEEKPIGVGFVGCISGNESLMGVSARKSMEIAVDEFNRDGGVNGRKVLMVVKDNACDPEKVGRLIGEFEEERVRVVVGLMTSNMAGPAIRAASDRKMLLVSPTVSTDAVSDLDDNFLRLIATAGSQARDLSRVIAAEGLERIAVLYDASNLEYSENVYLHFREAFEKSGGKIVYTNLLKEKSAGAYLGIADETIKSGAEACLIVASGIEGASIIQQFRKQGSAVAFYGSSWVKSNDFLKHGGRAIEGARLISNYERRVKSEAYRAFEKEYMDRYYRKPTYGSIYAYDATKVVLSALTAVGGDDPEIIKAWIINKSEFQGLEEAFSVNRFGDAIRAHSLVEVKNGKFVIVDIPRGQEPGEDN